MSIKNALCKLANRTGNFAVNTTDKIIKNGTDIKYAYIAGKRGILCTKQPKRTPSDVDLKALIEAINS